MFALSLFALALSACGQSQAPAPAPAPPPPKVADQPANPPPPQSAQQMFEAKIDAVLAGNWREAANTARDQYRHPKQTLEFFGLKPGMSLIEITPGAGWYAEILAPLMKGDGSYTAAIALPKKPEGEAAQDKSALEKMFAGDPAQYGEAKVVQFDPKAPNFGAPNSADMVVTFRNVHNWVMGDYAPGMFKAFFDVLKPGGVLGVADHRATPGADLAKIKDSGYLPEDYVIKLATDAGFALDGKSEANANPKDDHDHPKGVWTLPPTLALGDKDKDKYLAIGESDRMTLRFVKPGADKIFSAPADHSGKPATN
ncbi:MAG: class I SAM-dependent methyltransferase [Proteobacteria bacterium]|nr:class I SAM-dependent methyltransferase [Pseudomonadota bacterium]